LIAQEHGTEVWKPGSVWLAPIPRDAPSPFASASWLAPHRISSVTGDVAPGQVGEFALDITGSSPGESILELGWVAEGITWFADGPKGGGPEDGYFAVKVNVVPAPPPPDPGTGGSAGSTSGSGGSGAGWTGSAGKPATGTGASSAGPEDSADIEGGCSLSPNAARSELGSARWQRPGACVAARRLGVSRPAPRWLRAWRW
jgi:hypothetical protein